MFQASLVVLHIYLTTIRRLKLQYMHLVASNAMKPLRRPIGQERKRKANQKVGTRHRIRRLASNKSNLTRKTDTETEDRVLFRGMIQEATSDKEIRLQEENLYPTYEFFLDILVVIYVLLTC